MRSTTYPDKFLQYNVASLVAYYSLLLIVIVTLSIAKAANRQH